MGGTQYSVLITDDQENWRGLLAEVLEKEFAVVTARNYMEGCAMIAQATAPFHVVVTDMRLDDDKPGNEDGLELIQYLKSRGGETRTIIITGYPSIPSMQRAVFGLDVDYYFEKVPSDGSNFNKSAFVAIVRNSAKIAEERRNKLVFMLMPFADEYRAFYEEVIKKTIDAMGLECKRVDDFYQPHSIMIDIVRNIKNAKFILADLSGRNPNVFLEVGISHATGKHVHLLTRTLDDVPPKLRTVRCHVYEDTVEGGDQIAATLKKAVQESEAAGFPPFFAEQKFTTVPNSVLALVPNNKDGERTYNALICDAIKETGCVVEKASEIFDSNSVLDEIWAHINTSHIVIADLSHRDPDVFYLAGLAYGLKKKLILLARDETDIPFDLRAGSHLIYTLDTFAMGNKARQTLTKLIQDTLRGA